MGLQYYDIKLGLTTTQKVAAQGRYIYYLNGTTPLIAGGITPSAAGNQAIKVQAGQTGNTLILMPGQSYRVPSSDKAPSEWIITNAVGAEAITGQLLIGEGDFHDANTSNTSYVKLDATFANNVQVTNTTANRVPVTLDANQTLNLAGNIVAYTTAFTSTAGAVANTAIQMLAPGANLNGAVLNAFCEAVSPSAQSVHAIIAKATAPANIADGDVLWCDVLPSTTATKTMLDIGKSGQIKVPAGKGIWFIVNAPDATVFQRSALITVQ